MYQVESIEGPRDKSKFYQVERNKQLHILSTYKMITLQKKFLQDKLM